MKDSITWKIGGEAGFGIMSAGSILAKIFSRVGYHVFVTNEYPSLVRGGHNLVTVRIANFHFESMTRTLDVLIALNKETVELHRKECHDGTVIVYDPADYQWKETEFDKKVHLLAVPLNDILKKHQALPVMRNTIAIGATLSILGADFQLLSDLLAAQFRKKGDAVIKENVDVAKEGYDHITSSYQSISDFHLSPPKEKKKQLIINGSEAVGVAAVRSGLKYAAIYPMTPINALIQYIADHAKKYGIVYRQPEDEIAGINMAIGASLAGVRSLVATSGGGFALMVEGLALAGMVETPLVIDLGMRVGPATGMPTWTEQGELRFVIHAGHGEFARVVLAPGNAGETFDLTVQAFHLADKFQIPVFILTDKYLNESHWCVPYESFAKNIEINRGKMVSEGELQSKGDFKRYALGVDDGVSPRSVPGMKNGFYIANSYEHDETGFVTEDPFKRTQMADKRLKKLQVLEDMAPPPEVIGPDDAKITFVSWGTNRGPIVEAMKILSAKGIQSRLIHFSWMFPFPKNAVKSLLQGKDRLIDVEMNATAQLAGLIAEYTGIEIREKMLKYDGRPFYPEEIVERLGTL